MSIDWSQYQVQPEEEADTVSEQIPGQTSPLPEENIPTNWNKYRIEEKPPLPQKIAKETGRHAARTGSRVAETVLGFPGDIVQTERSLRENIEETLSKALPEVPDFISKLIEKDPVRKMLKQTPDLLGKLPTSEELKQFASKLTNEFTDPQGVAEEFGDEIVKLGTSLLMPGGIPKKFSAVLKALGQAAAAKGARKGAEVLGAGEIAQSAIEIGTLFLTGTIGKPLANAFVADKYKKARAAIPKGTMINTGRLSNNLKQVDAELAKGISTSTKSEVRTALSELEAKASGGAMEAEELVQSYHDLNERMTSKKLFDELNTSQRKLLKSRYDLVKKEVGKTLEEYGKSNPEFFNEWTEANQAFGTIAQSKHVSNWLGSKVKNIPSHLATGIAVELFLGFPKTAAATGIAAAGVKAGEVLYRIAKSPSLKMHYINTLSSIAKENLPATIKNLNNLQKELDKEESNLVETSEKK